MRRNRLPTPAAAAALAAAFAAAFAGCRTPPPVPPPAIQAVGFSVDTEEYQNYGEIKRTLSCRFLRVAPASPARYAGGLRLEWPSRGCGIPAAAVAAARRDMAAELLRPLGVSVASPDPSCVDAANAAIGVVRFFSGKESKGEVPPLFAYTASTGVQWPFSLPAGNSVDLGSYGAPGKSIRPVVGCYGAVECRFPGDAAPRLSNFCFNYAVPDGRRVALADYIAPQSMPAFAASLHARWREVAGDAPICGGDEGFMVEQDGLSWTDAAGKASLKMAWKDIAQWLK